MIRENSKTISEYISLGISIHVGLLNKYLDSHKIMIR